MERNALKGTLLFALRCLYNLCDVLPWLARSRKSALKEKGQETTAQGPAAVLGGQLRVVRNRKVRSQETKYVEPKTAIIC